jgi:hypothetical protein
MSHNVIETITAGSEKHTVIGTAADIQGVVYPAASGSERQHDTVPEERAELGYRVQNRLRYIYTSIQMRLLSVVALSLAWALACVISTPSYLF